MLWLSQMNFRGFERAKVPGVGRRTGVGTCNLQCKPLIVQGRSDL